ncbi:hypothetical protein GGX14DRAFT_420149 [Mycena pura]|uniref:Uncharacterized protein n=1 Tax=Mycena pura TaxID=153505 RepID=A0AAD6YP07_9AGAR|nr:hypothetical protein GGX14DRAFT_420149 [Mycena pura]
MTLSWFPQSPVTSDAPTEKKTSLEEQNGSRNESRTAEALPHDRILGNLFAGLTNIDPVHRGAAPDTANSSVYDPFDGSFLGNLVTPDQNVQPEDVGSLNDVVAKNDELWSNLSRVLELQSQISRMHLDMEEVGLNASDPKGKGKGTRSRATSVSRVVIDDAEGEEGIGGKRDEEAETNKAREEQFSKLSGQFRGKKEAINEIMLKLDSLSKAVTEFHALQAPKIDLPSSRQNSLPVTSAPASPEFSELRQSKAKPSAPNVSQRNEPQAESPHLVESPLTQALLPEFKHI